MKSVLAALAMTTALTIPAMSAPQAAAGLSVADLAARVETAYQGI
ncbi:hypothetical protein [Yoonia sp.]|nr:hypothetical protein [Yoonia sp.]